MSRERTGRPTRRTLLRRAGATGALAALGGCASRTDESSTRTAPPGTPPPATDAGVDGPGPGVDPEPAGALADEFGTVESMADATVEASGGEPINAVLDERAGDDTLLYFPPGRYLMTDSWAIENVSNFGVVGDGATVVPPDGYSGYLFAIGRDDSTDVRFEGITFDFTAENTGARPLQAKVDDGLVVRDVTVRGVQDTGQDSMRFDVTDPNGAGVVERLRLPDGGAPETPTTGCLVGPSSVGTLTVVDSRIEGFPDNGLYASPAPGPVYVLGGFYANNGVASVRVSGDSVVRGVTVRCDRARVGVENMRGIRLRQGGSILVEDCRVELREVTTSDGAITVAPWVESATVRDTDVRVDADEVAGVRVKPSAGGVPDGDGAQVRCRDVRITGSAAHRAAVEVADRDRCLFERLCIRQTGHDRDGVRLVRSEGSAVRDTAIDVTGEPLVLRESPAETSNVSVVPEDEASASIGSDGGAGATGCW